MTNLTPVTVFEITHEVFMDPKVRETLLILQEECAEVTQAVSKCFRFGLDIFKRNLLNLQ